MRKYLYDAAVCAAVILAAALLIVFPAFFKTTSDAELYVEISVDGKTEKLLPLYVDSEYTCSNGVTVTVEKGTAKISASDCRNMHCVHRGKLDSPGESVVCLPNKTVVAVRGSWSEVDGIVG